MECSNIISIIGLSLDIIGVIGLFISKTQGLKTIDTTRFYQSLGTDEVYNMVTNLKKDLNNIISQVNTQNQKIHKRSIGWLILIVAGFTLQLISYL